MTREAGAGSGDRAAEWEQKWLQPGFSPYWRASAVPHELRDAIETGWVARGGSVLDIGCGDGEIAARLAHAGFHVVGVDFAPSAIARARRDHGGAARLAFDVVDICRTSPPGGPFDFLLDRGCLQGVPAPQRPHYVSRVAAASEPGARFLLLHRLAEGSTAAEQSAQLEALLAEAFEVERVAETVMAREPATGEIRRGVALWMTRKA